MTQIVATASERKPHTSRWGYHSCDYETFLAIKKLARRMRRAIHMSHAHRRWLRKLPHNRVLRERLYSHRANPNAEASADALIRVQVGSRVIGPLPEPPRDPLFAPMYLPGDWRSPTTLAGRRQKRLVNDHNILADYAEARRPRQKPEDVRPLFNSREYILWLAKVAEDNDLDAYAKGFYGEGG